MHTHTHLQETLSFPLGDTVLGYSVLSTVCLPCCWMFCPLSHDLFPLLPLLVFFSCFRLPSFPFCHALLTVGCCDQERNPKNSKEPFCHQSFGSKKSSVLTPKKSSRSSQKTLKFLQILKLFLIWDDLGTNAILKLKPSRFWCRKRGVQVPQRNLLKPDIQVPQSLEKLENLPSQVISHPFGLGLMPHGVQVSQRNLASPSSPFVYPISLWCRRCHVLHCSRHG